jgi:biotin carboxylase
MSRLLLLATSTSYRAGAFLDAARELGVSVTVASDRAQALAAMNPDGHLVLDFRDLEHAVRAIERFAGEHPLAAILAADDDGVVIAAEAAGRLGLRHAPRAAVEMARDKLRFRRRLEAAGVPSPAFLTARTDDDAAIVARQATYPCVLKPVALSASRGVIRADDETSFVVAFRRIADLLARASGTASSPLLVERYVPGVEVALEGLVTDGRLRVLALFDKPDPLEGPFFEETIYRTPSLLPEALQLAIASRAGEVVVALGLTHGPVHAELRVNPQGIWPLEIAARPIGGWCSRALRFGSGTSLETLILRHAMGEDVLQLEREPEASGVMMIPIPRAGILRAVHGLEAARVVPGVTDLRMAIALGDRLEPLPEGARYLGFLFARDPAPERVDAALREAQRVLTFDIEPIESTPGEAPAPWSR